MALRIRKLASSARVLVPWRFILLATRYVKHSNNDELKRDQFHRR
jgi:hypothetical protein